MRHEFKYALGVFLLVPVVSLLFLTAGPSDASAQDCDIEICKSASGDAEFNFIGEAPSGPLEFTLTGGGEGSCDTVVSIPLTQSAEVFEEPLEGWRLVDIDCSNAEGVAVGFLEDGVSLMCTGPNLGSVTCTFLNVQTGAIPTLSEWGMISAVVGLGLVGVWFAVRRRKMQDA
ncbi:MAG: IPTL-CTERM sorting domain-containing protein [Thermodesulfobacteriota bacterium]